MADKKKDAEEEAPKKKKSKLLLIIILLVVLAVLGGGGYYAYITFLKPHPEAEEQHEAEAPKAEGEKKAEPKKAEAKKEEPKKEEKKEGGKEGKDKKPLVTSIQNIITNLADPGGKRYVKLSVDFDFDDDATAREFEEKYQAKIKDAILTLLWSKTSEDLSGIEGMQTFKMEIQSRVNQVMGQGKVKNVFITERVIQ